MKKVSWLAPVLALPFVVGCSKHSNVQSPQPAYGANYNAPQGQSVWDAAWADVTTGGKKVAHAGEWTFERAEDGALAVGHETKKVAGRVGNESEDAAVKGEIETRLVENKQVDADHVHVSVNNGVATLRGRVDSPQEASAAIRTTLDTRGVDRVLSYLVW